jgi:hypothetical protein
LSLVANIAKTQPLCLNGKYHQLLLT